MAPFSGPQAPQPPGQWALSSFRCLCSMLATNARQLSKESPGPQGSKCTEQLFSNMAALWNENLASIPPPPSGILSKDWVTGASPTSCTGSRISKSGNVAEGPPAAYDPTELSKPWMPMSTKHLVPTTCRRQVVANEHPSSFYQGPSWTLFDSSGLWTSHLLRPHLAPTSVIHFAATTWSRVRHQIAPMSKLIRVGRWRQQKQATLASFAMRLCELHVEHQQYLRRSLKATTA